MATKRGYQENFYNLYDHFRDDRLRVSKAEKAITMLATYGEANLSELRCLDIGCSTGNITEYLSKSFKQIVGIDIDRVALTAIKPAFKKKILFIDGDAMSLPFQDVEFDVTLCLQIYEHVPDDLQLFKEMTRVLKEKGIIFFSGPNKLFPVEPHYYLPFLHWLPEKGANAYLKLLRKGDQFYERSRTKWELRRIFSQFDILDLTIPTLRHYSKSTDRRGLKMMYSLISRIPYPVLKIFCPLVPNFNWILIKRPDHGKQKFSIIP